MIDIKVIYKKCILFDVESEGYKSIILICVLTDLLFLDKNRDKEEFCW